MYGLDGKVAIVTGAARGIGRAIALRLADEGADVVTVDLDSTGAADVAAGVRSRGRRSLAVAADVTRSDEVDRLVQRAIETLGRIDILVNNAGIQVIDGLLEMDEASWDGIFEVNVKAMWLCSRAVARELIKQGGGGRIINAGSRAGKVASPLLMGAYVTTKHAVIGFTRVLALELAPHNILVNAYCPGVVDTPMWDLIDREMGPRLGLPKGAVKANAVAAIPLGRIEQPADVARLVAFLASDESDYMTGQAINITGGSVMH
jgi:meso-butanediol dehydrogenase/(S,S)-butanediol dehydrogenase/diacetyl reductase